MYPFKVFFFLFLLIIYNEVWISFVLTNTPSFLFFFFFSIWLTLSVFYRHKAVFPFHFCFSLFTFTLDHTDLSFLYIPPCLSLSLSPYFSTLVCLPLSLFLFDTLTLLAFFPPSNKYSYFFFHC